MVSGQWSVVSGQWSVVSVQWSARTEGAYRSAFGGISRFRLEKAYRYRIYSVISLCEADILAVRQILCHDKRGLPLLPRRNPFVASDISPHRGSPLTVKGGYVSRQFAEDNIVITTNHLINQAKS